MRKDVLLKHKIVEIAIFTYKGFFIKFLTYLNNSLFSFENSKCKQIISHKNFTNQNKKRQNKQCFYDRIYIKTLEGIRMEIIDKKYTVNESNLLVYTSLSILILSIITIATVVIKKILI